MTQYTVQLSGGGGGCWVWEGQARLFHVQEGESPCQCSLSKALEEVRNEGVPQLPFHWAEFVLNFGGDPLHSLLEVGGLIRRP